MQGYVRVSPKGSPVKLTWNAPGTAMARSEPRRHGRAVPDEDGDEADEDRRRESRLPPQPWCWGSRTSAPLWHIGLDAPAVPRRASGCTCGSTRSPGRSPTICNSINGLNHYIGMKAIVPEAIPELQADAGHRCRAHRRSVCSWPRAAGANWLYAWTAFFAHRRAAGLVDFWYWGYDYGHDLDPTAAIKIPGFSYQPPVLGSKQLLNFTAHSWPALGGWAIVAALSTGSRRCAPSSCSAVVRYRGVCERRRDMRIARLPLVRRALHARGRLLRAGAGGHSSTTAMRAITAA